VQLVWIKGPVVPERFARQRGLHRAYACCPPGVSRALETGRFRTQRVLKTYRWDLTTRRLALRHHHGTDRRIGRWRIRPRGGRLVPFGDPLAGKAKPRVADELLISHVDLLPTLLAF
jgi:hypothetical protein